MPSVTITFTGRTGDRFAYLMELKDDQQNLVKSNTVYGASGESLDAAFDIGACFMIEAMEPIEAMAAKTTLVLGGLHG